MGSPSGVSLGFRLGFLGLLGLCLLLPSVICVVVGEAGEGGEAARWGRRDGILYTRPSQGGAFGASSPPPARSRQKARGGAVPRGGRISASPGGSIRVVFLESGGVARRCCSLPVFIDAGA
jgi:hypothetical protein